MGPQMIPEQKMPRDLRRALFETVELHGPPTGSWIIEGAIAPARQAIFTSPSIAEPFDGLAAVVEIHKAADDGYKVQNGLGANTGNRGRSDMMDHKDRVSDSSNETVAFPPCQIGPCRIMLR